MSGPAPSSLSPAKFTKRQRLRTLLPDIGALIAPRKDLLITGMILIALSRLASMAPALAMKSLFDEVVSQGHQERLPWIVLAVAGASIFQHVTSYILTRAFSRSTSRLIGELRCKLAAHVIRLPLLYHDANKSGSLGSRVMNDVQGLQNLVGIGFLNFIGSVMTSLIAVAIMARYSQRLAWLVMVALMTVGFVMSRGTLQVREIEHERTKLFADLMGRLTETISGVRVVKAYRAEEREEVAFRDGIARVLSNILKSVGLSAGLNLTVGLLWGGVGAAVLWIGAHMILAHQITLGEFFAFNVLLGYAVQPVMQVVGIASMFQQALAGLERTRELLDEAREDQDPRRTVAVGTLRGDVTFDRVFFAYQADKPVLEDFSFHAPPGTVTALVGPSGSGKSTTIGLIASFYIPTGGKVLVDGHDLTTLALSSYRAQLGVVLQETFLFAGTILENVGFARPGASREAILAACRAARVDEFAETLPDQYETWVGERGVLLSGGQRQRISIARALLADPRILILDEATASLDTHSEALIQEALTHLLVGRTTFVIAHRLSTIRRADQILVVERGRIVERGTHVELLAARGLYAGMYAKQHQLEGSLLLGPGESGVEEATKRPSVPTGLFEDMLSIQVP